MKSGKSINLLYLTYNENVLDSGILYGQVREMLYSMKEHQEIETIHLLSFISVRLFMRKFNRFRVLKREFESSNIRFSFFPMFAAQHWHILFLPIAMIFSLPVVIHQLINSKSNVVHSRSYMAGLLAMLGCAIVKINFVFDPRGPYPEEMVLNNRWKENGLTFRKWKSIERILTINSSAAIGVTTEMRDDLEQRGCKHTVYVPNRVNTNRFNRNVSSSNYVNTPVIVFTGEMDAEAYSPALIAKHFLNIKEQLKDVSLQLVTRKSVEFVRDGLTCAGLDSEDWQLEGVAPDKVQTILNRSHLALLLGAGQNAAWSVWPVKLAEYMACGLPLIVDTSCGEQIIRFVAKWRLGIIVDLNDKDSYAGIQEVIENYEAYAASCRRIAEMKLDISHTVRQYVRIYKQITS